MKRPSASTLFPTIAAVGVCSVALWAGAPLRFQESPQPLFRTQSDLVVLHVNVFDRSSDAVPDLPQTAFRVVENDQPQEIAFFAGGDVPVTVGLVIDNSTSMLTRRPMVVAGARAFAESSHAEDELFTVLFNEHVRYGLPEGVGFTRSGTQAVATLGRYPTGGKTALYDAVISALDHLDIAEHQKKVLLVLSDGGDNASRHTKDEMLQRAKASDAIIYTIMNRLDPIVDDDPDVMKRLAQLSGGVVYSPRSEREAIGHFGEIAANIRTGYSIGYVPSTTGTGFRNVKVMVLMPGRANLTARVRDGYVPQRSADVQ